VQHADQREEPPRGGEIGLDLALQPLDQQAAASLWMARRAMSMVSISSAETRRTA
jgi:hypothetical protein